MSARERTAGRRRIPVFGLILAGLGLTLLLLLAGLYVARRQLAREAVTSWLRSRGVASESRFQEIGPGRLVGRIRIGPADKPDLVADRVEVDYALAGLVSGRGVQVTSIRLVRPVLRARWLGGRFSAGALDPVIDEFRARPPRGGPSPRITVDEGRLELATDFGALRATTSLLLENGALRRLDATGGPTRLQVGAVAADLRTSSLRAQGDGRSLRVTLEAPFASLKAPQATAQDGVLTVIAETPQANLAGALSGRATAEIQAATATAGPAAIRALRVRAVSEAVRWTRNAGEQLSGDLRLHVVLPAGAAAGLRLDGATADARGSFAVGRETSLRLAARAEGRGAWSGLGPPGAGDSRDIVALKRGLQSFRFSAAGLSVAAGPAGAKFALTAPLSVLPDRGGALRLAPQGRGYRVSSAGGGLPRVMANVTQASLRPGGFNADADGEAAFSVGPLQDSIIHAAGRLQVADGVATFAASRCAVLSARKLDLGKNDVQALSGELCPAGGPMLRVGAGGWAIAGRARGVAARVPFLQVRVAHASGAVRLAQAKQGGLSSTVALDDAQVRDTAPTERFRPLRVSGHMGLAEHVWAGALALSPPRGPVIAHAVLRHDDRTGVGRVEVDTGQLSFSPGGLQPDALSPILSPLGSSVQGSAAFSGAVRWTSDRTSSEGRLRLAGLDFRSPAGPVTGLSGQLDFSSLAPLIAPPGQVLRAERIEAIAPLRGVTATLALDEQAVTVSGEALAAGGHVRLESLRAPLARGETMQGTVWLEAVQLRDLVAASPFADRVSLDAKVSGRIPFQVRDGRLHISSGQLHAVAPGRLSINRAALTSVSATGAPAAGGQIASTDTFTDFAYQALENLAFDKLDATVDTRPDGRLGVLFHIVGRHDPPQRQEITLSWLDLIQRRFIGRRLPLPSDTGVDLTLDTTLNLDDLLSDYGDYERLRSSPPVQRRDAKETLMKPEVGP